MGMSSCRGAAASLLGELCSPAIPLSNVVFPYQFRSINRLHCCWLQRGGMTARSSGGSAVNSDERFDA
jgi:hypothetical protein